MELLLKRIELTDTSTTGKLFIDGKYECDTLEDKVRKLSAEEPKIFGETAIPYGKYEITLQVQSQKFSKVKTYEKIKGYLPRLLNVPQFDGILIHIGNTPENTSGCILVGKSEFPGALHHSTQAFWALYEKLKYASDNKEAITINIV